MTARLVAVSVAVLAGIPLSLAPFATLSLWLAGALLAFLAVQHTSTPISAGARMARAWVDSPAVPSSLGTRSLVSPARPHRSKTLAPLRWRGQAQTAPGVSMRRPVNGTAIEQSTYVPAPAPASCDGAGSGVAQVSPTGRPHTPTLGPVIATSGRSGSDAAQPSARGPEPARASLGVPPCAWAIRGRPLMAVRGAACHVDTPP